jgi:ATP-dependent exoDNAse (exonuclease V) beta subunit
LGDACKVTTEKPFLLRADEMLVEGRMDLFVERTDGIDIIDFKSDATQDSARYATQLELYRMAAQEFAPGKSVRLGIFWLRTAELAWLQSETGDALLAALREIGSEAADGAV